MSVSINYKGRFGNHLFQYITGRLFADNLGLKLKTPFNDPLVRMHPQAQGIESDGPERVITDFDDFFRREWPQGRYVLDGFFQDAEWLYKRRDQILRFAETDPVYMKSGMDIVMNIRLGSDYKAMGWVIDPSWYLGILKKETFNRLHIVIDEMDLAYLSNFKSYDPIIVAGGKESDWKYLRSFDRVICSNSTFCWWAVFFSMPSKLYMFRRWVGLEGHRIEIPGSVLVDGMFQKEVA